MSEQLAELYHSTMQRLAESFGIKPLLADWDAMSAKQRSYLIAVADLVELAHFGATPDADGVSENIFTTSAGYGFHTQAPFVGLIYNGRKLAQMPPEQAESLAHDLMLCAHLSVSDTFMIEFCRDEVGMSEDEMVQMLGAYRYWRAHRLEHSAAGEDYRHTHNGGQ